MYVLTPCTDFPQLRRQTDENYRASRPPTIIFCDCSLLYMKELGDRIVCSCDAKPNKSLVLYSTHLNPTRQRISYQLPHSQCRFEISVEE